MAKILVVDDITINRRLMAALLSHEGHEIIEASDGSEALTRAREQRPQLIISDILMPTMDGYELVRQLRADTTLADVAVIFHTAHYHEREARNLAQACGVSHVLTKPTQSQDVLRAVRETLDSIPEIVEVQPTAEFDRAHLRVITDKLAQKAEELQFTNARLAALVDLGLHLASERDPGTLLEKVCRGARSLIGAKYGLLMVKDKHNESLIFKTSGLDIDEVARLKSPHPEDGPLAAVLAKRRACRFANPDGDPQAIGLPAGYPTARSMLAAPVTSLTNHYGWIFLLERLGANGFNADDQELLGILTAQVGRIYENGSLYKEIQRHAESLLLEMAERERAIAGLAESEERFRQLAESVQDVFWITSPDRRKIIYLNPAYEHVWGRSMQSAYSDPLTWWNSVHPDDRERVDRELARGADRHSIEYRIERPDGEVRWILDRGFALSQGDGVPYRMVGIATDITAQKDAEAKIKWLNRVHAVLSSISSLIVRVHDRNELFREACRLAVEQGLFKHVWIGLYDLKTGAVNVAARAGDVGLGDQQAPSAQRDLALAAIHSHQAELCNDIEAEVATLHGGPQMLELGYRSVAALPLMASGESIGCMVMYANERGLFNPAEVNLLTELAGDISFALEYIEKAEKLNYLAYYDVLTRLANRALFQDRVAHHIATAVRKKTRFALVVADVERLRNVNETYGRHAGDELLRQMANRFTLCVGETVEVARTGSHHFSAVITDVDAEEDVARKVDSWWRHWLGEPYQIDGHDLRANAKAGIALFPDDGQTADELLRNAEAAAKKAKVAGEEYLFFTQELGQRVAEGLALESKLRRALDRNEFVLYYQPKVDTQTRRLTGLEALIRWRSPELGLVPPAKFIPLMEETGMIVEAGTWVMQQADQDRLRWLKSGLVVPRVAVNISTIQLRRQDFVRSVADILSHSDDGGGIDIEVTESLLMDDVDNRIEKLEALRKMGVGIAIDDFGTGYSSLRYLARLPVTVLKIDRSFIADMLDVPTITTLVSTIISMAHSLRLAVVAEGVETEEQAKMLRLLRCDQLQGYLISQPLSFEDMTARLVQEAGQRA